MQQTTGKPRGPADDKKMIVAAAVVVVGKCFGGKQFVYFSLPVVVAVSCVGLRFLLYALRLKAKAKL